MGGDVPFPWSRLNGEWPFPLGFAYGKPEQIAVRGTLGKGVECPTVVTDGGKGYTLVGLPREFAPGDHVELSGVVTNFSYCMQGETIAIQHISKISAPMTASLAGGTGTGVTLRPVMEVDRIDIQTLFREPPLYSIHVFGKAPTTGWSSPTLVPVPSVSTAPDGILEYRFEAKPPEGQAGNVVVPISVQQIIDPERPLRGIRIHSATNTKTWPSPWWMEVARHSGGETPSPFVE